MAGPTKPNLGGALSAAPTTEATVTEEEQLQDSGDGELLDPQASERRYWRDPLTGTQREIWRPGKLFASKLVWSTKLTRG